MAIKRVRLHRRKGRVVRPHVAHIKEPRGMHMPRMTRPDACGMRVMGAREVRPQ